MLFGPAVIRRCKWQRGGEAKQAERTLMVRMLCASELALCLSFKQEFRSVTTK